MCSCLRCRYDGRISLSYPGSVRWQHSLALHTDGQHLNAGYVTRLPSLRSYTAK